MAAPRPSWAAAGGGAASFSGISGDLIADSSSLSLSEEVSAGLTALGRLGSPAAGLVVDAAWAALLTPTTTGSSIASTLERDSRVGAGEAAKLAASGILALLLEAARLAAAPDAVRAVLAKEGVAVDLATSIAQAYAAQLKNLRELHKGPGLPVPHLVDVDWRLDYVVKSSVAGAVNQPLYIVKLTTTNTGSPLLHHVQFTCSPPQLEDLLAKVSDATRAVSIAAKDL